MPINWKNRVSGVLVTEEKAQALLVSIHDMQAFEGCSVAVHLSTDHPKDVDHILSCSGTIQLYSREVFVDLVMTYSDGTLSKLSLHDGRPWVLCKDNVMALHLSMLFTPDWAVTGLGTS